MLVQLSTVRTERRIEIGFFRFTTAENVRKIAKQRSIEKFFNCGQRRYARIGANSHQIFAAEWSLSSDGTDIVDPRLFDANLEHFGTLNIEQWLRFPKIIFTFILNKNVFFNNSSSIEIIKKIHSQYLLFKQLSKLKYILPINLNIFTYINSIVCKQYFHALPHISSQSLDSRHQCIAFISIANISASPENDCTFILIKVFPVRYAVWIMDIWIW